MATLLGGFVILTCAISTAFACNGYEVRDLVITTCDNQNEVLDLDNFSALINDQCEVVPSGCIVVKKQINEGKGEYKVVKKSKMGMPLKLNGKKDLCPLLENSKDSPEASLVFKLVNLGQQCPIPEGKICANGNVSIGKYKDQIRMLEGDFDGTIKAKVDSGDICLHFTMTVANKGKSSGFPMG